MAVTLKQGRRKWDDKSKSYTFIGYSSESKAYKLLDLDTHILIKSPHVVFWEEVFLFDKDKKRI